MQGAGEEGFLRHKQVIVFARLLVLRTRLSNGSTTDLQILVLCTLEVVFVVLSKCSCVGTIILLVFMPKVDKFGRENRANDSRSPEMTRSNHVRQSWKVISQDVSIKWF